jgi:hypothetical protein
MFRGTIFRRLAIATKCVQEDTDKPTIANVDRMQKAQICVAGSLIASCIPSASLDIRQESLL